MVPYGQEGEDSSVVARRAFGGGESGENEGKVLIRCCRWHGESLMAARGHWKGRESVRWSLIVVGMRESRNRRLPRVWRVRRWEKAVGVAVGCCRGRGGRLMVVNDSAGHLIAVDGSEAVWERSGAEGKGS